MPVWTRTAKRLNGIWFKYLRQVVELSRMGVCESTRRPIHLHVFYGEIPDQNLRLRGDEPRNRECHAPSSQGTHSACLTAGQRAYLNYFGSETRDWRVEGAAAQWA